MMKKHITRLLLVCLLMAIFVPAFSSCEKADETLTLYVYNWGEYISDEDDEEYGLFDVNAGFDPNYPSVLEKHCAEFIFRFLHST